MMAEQAWYSPETAGTAFGAVPPPPLPPIGKPAYELRPLTTGELLDRTFYLYRSNFWLFVSLASIAAAVSTAINLASIVYTHYTGVAAWNGTQVGRKALESCVFSLVALASGVLTLSVYGVTQAATTSAVTSIYLSDPTSMKQAFGAVAGNWFRFTLIALWQIWSAMWAFLVLLFVGTIVTVLFTTLMRGNTGGVIFLGVLMVLLVIGGLVFGVIAFIRNSFAVPAAVMENLKVRKAMRRSKRLTSGTKGRIFLLYVFVTALYFVAVAIQSPLSIMILQKKTTQILLFQALGLFVGFLSGSVIGPVGAIGLCLFYIDQRIRKEGFDIEFLIERSGPIPMVPPPPMAEAVLQVEQSPMELLPQNVGENP